MQPPDVERRERGHPAQSVSAYVSMLPVDASSYLGAGRPADMPLSMSDAGTLAYLEEMHALVRGDEATCDSERGESGGGGESGESGDASGGVDDARSHDGVAGGLLPSAGHAGVRRQSRSRRVERWRERLPLLDEDPREHEIAQRPPGEEDGRPATLTALGEKLVGLTDWE